LNTGGAEKQAIEDANMLCEKFNVVLLTFRDGPMHDLLNSKVKVLVVPKTNYPDAVRKITAIIREYKIDLLHAHLYAPMVLTAIAGRLTGKPVIWNFHSHAYENSFKAKTLHKFTARLSSVKKILFPAKELTRYYETEGYGLPPHKVEIAYNSGQQHDNAIEKAPRNEDSVVSIGYIGRIVELKRIEYLVELAEYLNLQGVTKYSIDIVGDGPELNRLTRLVNDKKLGDVVTFHGFQSNTVAFFRKFDIFALPSREEVLSLSLIDAGLSGIPSVAFHVGGNDDILIDGVSGYLVDTKESFFTRIAELLRDPSLRQLMGADAGKECRKKFSPETRMDYLTRMYALYI
jgi:L-malate glycosyltransferase